MILGHFYIISLKLKILVMWNLDTSIYRSWSVFELSQRSYVDKVLKRFGMHDNKNLLTFLSKQNKFSLDECPKDNLFIYNKESDICSSMYTSKYIAYIIGILGWYLRNPNIELITLIYKGYVGLIMKLIAKKSSVFMTQVIPKKSNDR